MFFFSVGLAIPYLLVALFISRGMGVMSRLARHKRVVAIVTGLFMVVLGRVYAG
jgi:cytochrome c-type biogenesis protein